MACVHRFRPRMTQVIHFLEACGGDATKDTSHLVKELETLSIVEFESGNNRR